MSKSESERESLNDSESKPVDANDDNNSKDEDEIKNVNNYFKTIDESAPIE